jgi:hypothetical protein
MPYKCEVARPGATSRDHLARPSRDFHSLIELRAQLIAARFCMSPAAAQVVAALAYGEAN